MKDAVSTIQSIALPREGNAKRIVAAGLCALALSVSVYVYFVGKIVFDVIGRRAAETSIRKELSAVSSLESAYLKEMQSIGIEEAHRLGLRESSSTLYASRSTATASLAGTGL